MSGGVELHSIRTEVVPNSSSPIASSGGSGGVGGGGGNVRPAVVHNSAEEEGLFPAINPVEDLNDEEAASDPLIASASALAGVANIAPSAAAASGSSGLADLTLRQLWRQHRFLILVLLFSTLFFFIFLANTRPGSSVDHSSSSRWPSRSGDHLASSKKGDDRDHDDDDHDDDEKHDKRKDAAKAHDSHDDKDDDDHDDDKVHDVEGVSASPPDSHDDDQDQAHDAHEDDKEHHDDDDDDDKDEHEKDARQHHDDDHTDDAADDAAARRPRSHAPAKQQQQSDRSNVDWSSREAQDSSTAVGPDREGESMRPLHGGGDKFDVSFDVSSSRPPQALVDVDARLDSKEESIARPPSDDRSADVPAEVYRPLRSSDGQLLPPPPLASSSSTASGERSRRPRNSKKQQRKKKQRKQTSHEDR